MTSNKGQKLYLIPNVHHFVISWIHPPFPIAPGQENGQVALLKQDGNNASTGTTASYCETLLILQKRNGATEDRESLKIGLLQEA